MRHPSLDDFLRRGRAALAPGPVALLLVEDAVEVASTLRHHLDAGFRSIVAFAAPGLDLPALDAPVASPVPGPVPGPGPGPGPGARVTRVDCDMSVDGALARIVNGCIDAAPPGTWLAYLYNAEYLFFPFCEHRSVGELCTFVAEERRASVLTYVIDLYAGDLQAHPTAVSLADAHLDRTGFYALARKEADGRLAERQLDFFGGLRWRYEEHVPPVRRRIDRVAIFRAAPGLRLRADHTFDVPEYNTYACPWHNSPTATLCSFRTAKALKRNPGSAHGIHTFLWHNSAPFGWRSQQLLDLGLMEPGQWF